MTFSMPYVIGVTLSQSGGSARANATVKLTNNRTGDTLTQTTNSSGQAIFDAANFDNGYELGDSLNIEKQVLDSDMEYFVTE